jgi:glycosyltransferase involved in cell wall biosynthesis
MQAEDSTGPGSKRRIIHVTASLSRRGGGIPPVIWSLARQTQKLGNESIVSGLKDEDFDADCRSQTVPVIAGAVCGPWALGYSPELRRTLGGQIRANDVVHVHGIWMYPGALAFKLSRRAGCRRVVSPHGMLEPWALKHSRLKKRVAGWLFETRNLHTADCLHALCDAEAENFRQYGLRNPIAIIPNGVELEEPPPGHNQPDLLGEYPQLKERQLLLFLSRVHPKKGLPDLFHAWAKTGAGDKNWSLLVVGPNELDHESELRKLADDLKISRHIHFMGPAYGSKKQQWLRAADAFVLPSHSEGFSMAVLEAAAAGLPVLLTKECNFPELAAVGAAVEVPAGLAGIPEGLQQFLQLTQAQRGLMGSKGKELVKRSYVWPAVAAEMVRVYDWLARTGPEPDCIRLD